MKKAVTLHQYSDAKPFSQPSGVVDVQLDKTTNLLATPACPQTYSAAFVAGTEPSETCDQTTGMRGFFSRVFGLGGEKALPPPPPGAQPAGQPVTLPVPTRKTQARRKKGFLARLRVSLKTTNRLIPRRRPSRPTMAATVPSRCACSRLARRLQELIMGRRFVLLLLAASAYASPIPLAQSRSAEQVQVSPPPLRRAEGSAR